MSKKVMSAVTMRRPNRSQPGHMSIVSQPKQTTTSRASVRELARFSHSICTHETRVSAVQDAQQRAHSRCWHAHQTDPGPG